MSGQRFTLRELVAEADREVAMRRRCYPQWVAAGRKGWTDKRAAMGIAVMEAVAANLRAQVIAEDKACPGPLFGGAAR